VSEHNQILEVDRSDPGHTRLLDEELGDLTAGQVRMRIDRFALTANNVTYAKFGDMLGYWGFFPTDDPWGRVPAMGWADVVESAHPGVEVGSRYYGWFPMARFVDMTVSVTDGGLRDDGPHRSAHAPVYRTLLDVRSDPWYEPGGDGEDRHALLRGLFVTGLLADEFFADTGYFGADAVIVLSASSKTAIGFAQRANARGLGAVVGVTSAGNVDFVRSLGWYDEVLSYDELAAGDPDVLPVGDAVLIDMAGDQVVLANVHALLGDRLKYSMVVGNSHHDSGLATVSGGPQPQMFFAPTEVSRRVEEWGKVSYESRLTAAIGEFVAGSRSWLTIERSVGAEAADAAYHDVYDGRVPPSVGRIVSLHDD
jgi:hypothetical protein